MLSTRSHSLSCLARSHLLSHGLCSGTHEAAAAQGETITRLTLSGVFLTSPPAREKRCGCERERRVGLYSSDLLHMLFGCLSEMLLAVLMVTAMFNQVKKILNWDRRVCFFSISHTLLQDFRSLRLKLLQMHHPTPAHSHGDPDHSNQHLCFLLETLSTSPRKENKTHAALMDST